MKHGDGRAQQELPAAAAVAVAPQLPQRAARRLRGVGAGCGAVRGAEWLLWGEEDEKACGGKSTRRAKEGDSWSGWWW